MEARPVRMVAILRLLPKEVVAFMLPCCGFYALFWREGIFKPSNLIFRNIVVLWMPRDSAVLVRFQLFRRKAFMRNVASICLKEAWPDGGSSSVEPALIPGGR